MSVVAADELEHAGPAGNYRQALATALPALVLSYVLLIWPLLYAGDISSADIGPGASAATQNFLLNRLFFPFVFVLGSAIFLAERPAAVRGNGVVFAALIAFWAICGISIGWALAPGKATSQFLLLTIGLLGLGLAAMVSGSLEKMLRLCFAVVVITVALNFAYVLLRPPGPIGHEGIYAHKNALGAVAAMCLLFAVYGLGRRNGLTRLISLLMVPAILLILWESESKTSLGFALIAPVLAAMLFAGRRYLRIPLPLLLALTIGLAIGAVLVLGEFGFDMGDISRVITGDPTFTGRTDVWAFALEQVGQRPWLGHGFRSFWEIGQASPALHAAPGFVQRTPHGHNGYIDMLLHVGIVGFGAFVLLVLAVAGKLSRLIDSKPGLGYFCTSLLVFILLHNLLESTWFEPLDANATLFLLLIFAPVADTEHRA